MVTYARVKRFPGKSSEIVTLKYPPQEWDEKEDIELSKLAQHAGVQAWQDSQEVNKGKASQCKQQMMNELRIQRHE